MGDDKPIQEKIDEEREDDGQVYVDRDKVDFDPADGLLSGTAVDGTSEIPGSEDSEGLRGGSGGDDDKGGGDGAGSTDGKVDELSNELDERLEAADNRPDDDRPENHNDDEGSTDAEQ